MKRQTKLVAAAAALFAGIAAGALAAQSRKAPPTPDVLKEMAAAYHQSETVRFDVTEYEDGTLTRTSRFFYARPASLRAETQTSDNKLTAISNYDTVTLITPDGRERNVKSAPGVAVMQSLAETNAKIHPFLMIETGTDLVVSTAAAAPVGMAQIIQKPDAVVNRVPTATVALTFKEGKEQTAYTYSIGKQDHLLRRVVVESKKDGQTHIHREDYTNVAANVKFPVETFLSPSVIARVQSLHRNNPR